MNSHFLARFMNVAFFAGKNWDLSAALSDFEQLRQVHAGNLSCTFAEEREYPSFEKEMARTGRPLLHRQDEVQGTKALESLSARPDLNSQMWFVIFVNDLHWSWQLVEYDVISKPCPLSPDQRCFRIEGSGGLIRIGRPDNSLPVSSFIFSSICGNLNMYHGSSHGEATVEGNLSRQLHHRLSGPLTRVQYGRKQRATSGNSALHLPVAWPHRLQRRLPRLHRERPHWAVHVGGLGARWLVISFQESLLRQLSQIFDIMSFIVRYF